MAGLRSALHAVTAIIILSLVIATETEVEVPEDEVSDNIGVDLGGNIGVGVAEGVRCVNGHPKGEDGITYCQPGGKGDSERIINLAQNLVVLTPKSSQTDAYSRFLRSLQTFKYQVKELGTGKTVLTDQEVLKHIKEELAILSKEKTDSLVLYVDSIDAVLAAGPIRVVEEFGFSEAGILISGDSLLREDKITQSKFPKVTKGLRYMDTGAFVASATSLSDLLTEFPDEKNINDVLTKAYGKTELRKRFKIRIDSECNLFQNLDEATGDVEIRFAGKEPYLQNMIYNTVPVVVRATGNTAILMNNFGSYLARSWEFKKGCVDCWTDMTDLAKSKPETYPIITLGIFIERPIPFMEEFFETINATIYPKDRINLFVHNAVEFHSKLVNDWIVKIGKAYKMVKSINFEQAEIKEWHAKNEATKFCLENESEYIMYIDAEARLNNPHGLRLLVSQNRNVVAPMLPRPGESWSNFWGALTPHGFYARSHDYMELVENRRRGLWNVPYINGAVLVKRAILENAETKPSFISGLSDPDVAFCENLRKKGIFMYVSNRVDFGHLISTETYDHTRFKAELWELFENRFDWERRYLHVNYSRSLNESNKIDNPCPDVYWFPVFTERYATDMIELMESTNYWSAGSHSDPRIEGGYESVPTVDIHMKQVSFQDEYLEILRAYIQPLQLRVFPDYYNEFGAPRCHMNFVVRYRPDEQPFLRPHHDTSTYTINVALNTPGVDFQGGGCRFVRYDCSVLNTRVGWTLMHPGKLTHLHEGLRVTEGTRYIIVSFVDP